MIMVSLLSKGFFLFLFILPDVLVCHETEWPLFVEDSEGNRFYMGLLPERKRLPEKELVETGESLPESFDAREQWPECISITDRIRSQKHCGSCWAFSVTEVISDRICIKSKGTKQVMISPEDLMSCCKGEGCQGCQGGQEADGLEYWIQQGIVTGGDFDSHEGCRPYTIPNIWDASKTPPCNQTCEEEYPIDYDADKHYGLNVYSINADEKQIQQEIYDNGPVCGAFFVFDEFLDYKSGVFNHTTLNGHTNHAIKILGWGVEDGTPYWLCANSWGVQFGEKGYFKMLRGDKANNCNIENYIHAGIPKL